MWFRKRYLAKSRQACQILLFLFANWNKFFIQVKKLKESHIFQEARKDSCQCWEKKRDKMRDSPYDTWFPFPRATLKKIKRRFRDTSISTHHKNLQMIWIDCLEFILTNIIKNWINLCFEGCLHLILSLFAFRGRCSFDMEPPSRKGPYFKASHQSFWSSCI